MLSGKNSFVAIFHNDICVFFLPVIGKENIQIGLLNCRMHHKSFTQYTEIPGKGGKKDNFLFYLEIWQNLIIFLKVRSLENIRSLIGAADR